MGDLDYATLLSQQPGSVAFVEYNEAGYLLSFGAMREEDFHATHQYTQRKLLMGNGHPDTHYVEFVGESRAPVLRVRPQLEQSFDKAEIAVREPATMVGLPPASVTFDGPVKGRHAHEGGDLVVGWTVPGTYTVCVEAFPALPAIFALTVGATA
jgi:hypothetical protein